MKWKTKNYVLIRRDRVYVKKKLNINDLFFVSFLFFGGVKEVNINIYIYF